MRSSRSCLEEWVLRSGHGEKIEFGVIRGLEFAKMSCERFGWGMKSMIEYMALVFIHGECILGSTTLSAVLALMIR